MRTIASLLALAVVMAGAVAQTPDAARKELSKKEAAAARNPDALQKVGEWAKEHGFADEAKRIFQNVLKLKPDHQAANEALGNVLVDGKWMTAKDAEAERKRALAAEMEAKGLVEVDGLWVPKDQADDARKGIFRVGDLAVSKAEFVELTAGKVRHPITGEPIDAKDLEQAKKRMFPVGKEGRWVDEAEADEFHAEVGRSWTYRTQNYVLLTTLPIAKIEAIKEHADRAFARLQPILGFAVARPAQRPTLLVASTTGEFRQFGNQMGDASSAFGAFLAAEQVTLKVALMDEVRPTICLWDDGWGPYNLPHALGIAYVNSLCAEIDTEVPAWFLNAMGAYASRFESPETGAWFAQRLAKAGGLKDLGPWFRAFKIDGSMEFDAIDATMTQAGFLIDFCVRGGDDEATKAIQAVTAAFTAKKASAIDKAIKDLQAALTTKQGVVADYLVKLVKAGG